MKHWNVLNKISTKFFDTGFCPPSPIIPHKGGAVAFRATPPNPRLIPPWKGGQEAGKKRKFFTQTHSYTFPPFIRGVRGNRNLEGDNLVNKIFQTTSKKNSGFTLTEMLVTAVVFGVLSAVVAPNLMGLLHRARVNDGVASVEGAIKEAQRQSIRYSQSCDIGFATEIINGKSKQVVRTGAAPANDRCLLDKRVLYERVTIEPQDGFAGPITFSSKGNIDLAGDLMIKVSHNNISTSKCLLISGIFGDIKTGIYQDTDGSDGTVDADGCNITGD